MIAMRKASTVELMVFDIDGVMTDGRLYFSPRGDEMKGFSSRDGLGLKLLAKGGVRQAIITGRDSPIVAERARNLGIDLVLQGVEDKRAALASLLQSLGLDFSAAGFMGDDLIDLPAMRACAFSAAVPDAHPLVKRHADYLCLSPAGLGAVREVCELLLQASGRWDEVIAPYLAT